MTKKWIVILNILTWFYTIQLLSQKTLYEAEDAVILGSLTVQNSITGYSGSGYVGKFENNSDKVTFSINIQTSGYYNVYIGFATPYGEKINILNINGNKSEVSFLKSSSFTEISFGKAKLSAGINTISIEMSWGWFLLDYIAIEKNNDPIVKFKLPYELVTPQPLSESVKLHNYLMVNYGKNIQSGAMNLNSWEEAEWLFSNTGKYPALIGLDYLNHNRNYSWFDKTIVNKTATEWYNSNGLVTIGWHWRDPLKNTEGFYTNETDFDVSQISDTTSAEYKAMIDDIDIISGYLKELNDSAVPILWRPLHEASGGWFWWGAKGAEPCKQLWKTMFDRMVDYHGLNNLIWIWTTDTRDSNLDWYPGDEYVDILGIDIYADSGDFSSQVLSFEILKNHFNGKKLITLSECGVIPDPDNLVNDEVSWSWFMPWYGDYIRNESCNPLSHWNKIMNHEYVITLDEMPDLRNYNEEVGIPPIISSDPFPRVYYNRLNGAINILNDKIINRIRIFNISGMIIQDIHVYSSSVSIPFSDKKNGIYIIQFESESGFSTHKILR